MFLSEVGFKHTSLILHDLLLSKYLTYNFYVIPNLKTIKVTFPFFEEGELNKSKLLITIMGFLERITQCKPILTNIKILFKKGIFFRCEVSLTKWQLSQFCLFFNEFVLNYLLTTQTTTQNIKLIKLNKKSIGLHVYNLDSLFDAHTRRILPRINCFGCNWSFHIKIIFIVIIKMIFISIIKNIYLILI